MKKLLFIITLSILLQSCKKDEENLTPVAPSKMELLTHKQWIYTELYYNATAPRQGTLVYRRGAPNNIENRDNTRAFFWRDGVFDEVQGLNSPHTRMTWFFSSDSTKYNISWGSGNTNVNIIQLDQNTFEWFNPTQQMSAVMTSRL